MPTGSARPRASATPPRPRTPSARRSSADDTVSLFVQFADPDNERFELVRKLGGHLVPVIDRTILRQEVARQEDLLRAGDAGRERAVDQVGPQARHRLHAARAVHRRSRPRAGRAGQEGPRRPDPHGRPTSSRARCCREESLFQRLVEAHQGAVRRQHREGAGGHRAGAREGQALHRQGARDGQGDGRAGQAGDRARRRGRQALLSTRARKRRRRPTTTP